MADNYTAKATIETVEANRGLTDLSNAARTAGASFAVLDKALKGSNTNLKDAASALKSVVESTRQGAIAAKALADAELRQARASGTAAKDAANLALANQRKATSASQAALAEGRLTVSLDANARAAQRATEVTQRHTMSQERAAGASARRAQAEQRAAAATLEVTDHLSNSRYLLYDVAATYQMLSTALLAIPVATTAVAIAYERDMAQVIRTNDAIWGSTEGIDNMKNGLKDLASEIPVSFGELANIASIGGQLGIASSEMLKFTETVAKFGAASNVTTEAAATAFGRLQNAFPKDAQAADFFNKIGSSIAYVGVKSVATETEIIAVANQLSALAAQSGFTAEQVVGLSGALASVRIRPELARGAFLSTMTKMTNAADEGATAFGTYAKYLDMTGAAGKELFESDPGDFFNQFIQGIAKSIENGQSFSSVMSDLGVKEKRETQFLLGLANGHEVLGSAMSNSAKAYDEGTFLDDSTARVFSTVSAELTKLSNNFKNLGDTLAGGTMNLFAEFLRLISGAVKGITDLAAANPVVAQVISGLLGFGAVVGVLLAFKAAQAAALAAVVAFRQVVGSGITSSISFSGVLKELTTTMLMARGATLADAQAHVARNGILRSSIATSAQVAAGTTAVGTAATGATGRIAAMGGAARGAGAAMLGLVGGPIGALVAAIALVGAGFFAAGAEAKAAGKLMAEGIAAGLDEGNKAIAERLVGLEVGLGNISNSALTDWGKNIGELGKQAGVSMETMVNAVRQGTGSLAALDAELEVLARTKGFDGLQDWLNSDKSGFDKDVNNIKDIRFAVQEMGKDADKGSRDMELLAEGTKGAGDAASGATPAMDEFGGELDSTGTSAEDATQGITSFIDSLFGLVNAEGAAAASLEKLGAGLQNSTSFNAQDEGGRDNLAALQETLRNSALLQQQMVDSGEQSIQQAQSNYVAFVEALYADLASRGVDPSQIQMMVDNAKGIFNSAVNDANANDMAAFKATVDTDNVASAVAYLNQVVATYGTTDLEVLIKQEGGEQLVADVTAMSDLVEEVTGAPYDLKVNSEVLEAANNVGALGTYTQEVAGAEYLMVPQADVNPALAALQFLQRAAANVVNGIIAGINGLGKGMTGVMNKLGVQTEGFNQIAPVGWGQEAPMQYTQQRVPTAPKAPTFKSPASGTAAPGAKQGAADLANLSKGYDNAAKAAGGAGGAGKQAGKDMAGGIEEAQKSLDDYVSRLKSGLTDAYDRQYGMAEATDNYYKALNAINDKRKEDLKNIQDLITAQKELNNERNKDLVDARKAGIEKNISIKYGETDRAADYANQEQTALDNAAAKQLDIQANKDNQKSLVDGMNALTGYSNAAIANREALRGVESKMLDMIVAYAATGRSQQEVEKYAASLTSKFKTQTSQIGYAQGALSNLQGSLSRYRDVVATIPRTVNTNTTTSGTGSAGGALGGVANAANNIPRRVNTEVQITYLPVNDSSGALKGYREVKNGRVQAGVQLAFNSGGQVPKVAGFASGGQVPGNAPSDPNADNRFAQVDGKGLIGIRSKEWIIQQPAVDYYGSDFMDDLNNMRLPKFAMGGTPSGYASSGGSASMDGAVVALDAATLSALVAALDAPVNLFTDVGLLASTVNKGNVILASKGIS